MKAQAPIILAVAWTLNVQAQTTFMKIYLSTGTAKRNMIELSSQNLFVGLGWGPGISLMDPEGNIIQSNYYWSDTILVQQSVKRYSDNDFYFVTGYRKDTCTFGQFGVVTRIYPMIGRIDSLGDVSELHYYALNEGCLNLAIDLEITGDNGVITWGGYFVLKADSTASPLWARHFNNHGSFQFIKELPMGDLLAGMNMDTAGAVIARLDANGNFIWCKSYIRPGGMVHDCLIESDSSYIITGTTDSLASTNPFDPMPPGYHPRLFMMKLDGTGEVQWCKGYDSEPNLWYARGGSRIEKAQDGNYVVLANLGAVGVNLHYRPFLMKTDLNGDTLWTRSVGDYGYSYKTINLLAYSDGGFLFNGIVTGDLPQMWTGAPYIFKTDSLGYLPCENRWHPIEITDLFPTDSSFTLSSVDGATMHPAFVSDTIFDPIAVYDACTITTVMDPRAGQRFRVHPNPTTGRITVEFDDPLERDSFYSVYDELGRLLYQRPLPPGREKEEIDLSRFGRGAYVLRFTLPGNVRHERVVVE